MSLIPLANPTLYILSLNYSKIKTHFERNNPEEEWENKARKAQPRTPSAADHQGTSRSTGLACNEDVCQLTFSTHKTAFESLHFLCFISHTRFNKSWNLLSLDWLYDDFLGLFFPLFFQQVFFFFSFMTQFCDSYKPWKAALELWQSPWKSAGTKPPLGPQELYFPPRSLSPGQWLNRVHRRLPHTQILNGISIIVANKCSRKKIQPTSPSPAYSQTTHHVRHHI